MRIDRPERLLWVWHPFDANVLPTARAYGVTQLLIWVAPGFSKDDHEVAELRRLVRRGRQAGMRAVALGGDPSWALRPDVARSWAVEVGNSGLFSGVHLDIEPHALAAWQEETEKLSQGLVTAIQSSRESGLPVNTDVPAAYASTRFGKGSLLEAVRRASDSITVMAYRNDATTVLNVARPSLISAGHVASVYVGINVASPGTDPVFTTFQGASKKQFQAQLAEINHLGSKYASYAGLAIHDSRGLSVIR